MLRAFYISILALLTGHISYAQSGATDPVTAMNDSTYWYVMDQDINDAATDWFIKPVTSAARSISFNRDDEVVSYTPVNTFPANDQYAYDGSFNFLGFGVQCWTGFLGPGSAFDEWFVIKVPSTGNLSIELDVENVANTPDQKGGTTLQWYEFDTDVAEIGITPCPGPGGTAAEYKFHMQYMGGTFVLDLDENAILPTRRITRDHVLIRIGFADQTGGSGVISTYDLKVYTTNDLCDQALEFPPTADPFVSTNNSAVKNLLTANDEISATYFADATNQGVTTGGSGFANGMTLNGGSVGQWFKITTTASDLWYSACGSTYDPQVIVYNTCPTDPVAGTMEASMIGAEDDNAFDGTEDNGNGGTDVCLDAPGNLDIPVVKVTTGAAPSTTLYAYLFGNNSEGDFNFYILSAASGILPVEWLSFEGKALSTGNKLEWATATEINNSHFLLERSSDGENYSAIAEIQGSGNSSSENYYSFLDERPFEKSYYRISQIDFDGSKGEYKYSYLENRSVLLSLVEVANPVGDWMAFTSFTTVDHDWNIMIFSAEGELIKEEYVARGQDQWKINVQDLASGVYIIHCKNGLREVRKKIVKL